jgi:hypothetical protein
MKKFTFLLLFILTAFIGFSQNCTNPVSTPVFQNNFNQIAIQQTNQKKLEKANQFVGVNCLMSAQVKLIAQLFTEDAYRLEFCKLAYAHTYDQANFYDVYDAFAAFSFAFRLHDFIHPPANTTVVTQPVVTTPPAPTEPVYPNIAYPSSASYRGRRGCTGPVLNEGSFKLAAQNVFVQPTDESKQVAIQNIANSNCIDFAQLMKLVSMLRSENIRLQVMEFAYPKIFDLENYQPGIALFTNTQTQNQWTGYASGYLAPPPPAPAPVVCTVTANDFNGIMVSIKAKSFPADKLALIDVLANDRCFNVEQIKTIGKEFSFGDDKLKVFKKLYAKCPDQNNYYKLVDELSFSSEKDELNNFIKNGGK